MKRLFSLALILVGIGWSSSAVFAANEASQTFTLDGQLFHVGSTSPLVDSGAQLKVQILDPSQTCVLYEETQNVNTSATEGFFTLQVGSLPGSGKRTGLDPAQTMSSIIQNISPIPASSAPGQTCTSYAPSAGDTRFFRITVIPSSGSPDTLTPDMVLDSVPSAIVAQSVEGLDRGSILHTNTTVPAGEVLTQANLESLFTATAFANLTPILAGHYVQSGTAGASLPSFATDPSSPPAGEIWYNSATQNLVYSDGSTSHILGTAGAGVSSLTVTARLTANGVAGGTLSGPGTIDLNTVGTAGTYVKVTTDAYGRVTGNSLLAETDIPALSTAGKVSGTAINAGAIGGSASINTSGNLQTTGDITTQRFFIYDHAGVGPNYVGMTVPADLTSAGGASYIMTWPDRKGAANQVLTTDNTGQLSWTTPSTTDTSKVAKAGDTMTGPLNNNSNSASTALAVTQAGAGKAATFTGGPVGIGATNPSAQLANGPGLGVDSGGNSVMLSGLDWYGNSGGYVGGFYNFASGANGNGLLVKVSGNTSSNVALAVDQGATEGGSGTSLFRVLGNATVGIGIASPAATLDINGSQGMNEISNASAPAAAAGKDFIYADSTSHTLKASLNGAAYADILTGAAASGSYVAKAGDTMTGPLNNNSNSASTALAIAQSGSGYAATFTGGKVGIGNSAPTATLDVTGNLNLSRTSGTSSILNISDPNITSASGINNVSINSYFSPSGAPTGNFASFRNAATYNSSGNSASQVIGIYNQSFTTSGGGDTGAVIGISNSAINTFGTTTNLKGIDSNIQASAVSTNATGAAFGMTGLANVTSNIGVDVQTAQILGTSTTAKGYNVSITKAGPGAITTAYGLYIDNIQATTPYSIYASDATAPSYFAGNVGIGANPASSALDINGAQTIREIASGSAPAAAAGKDFIYADNTSHTLKASLNGAAYADILTGAAASGSYVAKGGDTMTGPLNNNSNSASTALAVAQSGAGYAATFTGGKVGIGTTSPSAQLTVVNAGSTTSAGSMGVFTSGTTTAGNIYGVSFDKNGTDALLVGVNKNSATGAVPSNSTFLTTFNTAGTISIGRGDNGGLMSTSDIFINSTGVGVNTTSPSSTLDVNGAETIREVAAGSAPTAAAGKDFIYADSTSHTLKVSLNGAAYVDIATGAGGGSYVAKGGDTMTGLLILSGDPSNVLGAVTKQYVDAAVTSGSYVPLAGGTMTGPLVNNSNSASTALRVTQSGAGYAAFFMGGNVGIGTTSPSFALDVNGIINAATSYSLAGSTLISVNAANKTEMYGEGASTSAGAGTGSLLIGYNAGRSIASGGNNETLIGSEAGQALTTGTRDTFVGMQAGYATTTGGGSTAVGYLALSSNVGNINNTAVGSSALSLMNGGNGNTALGNGAMASSTGGNFNTALGLNTMVTSTGANNVAIGKSAMFGTGSADSASQNVVIGSQAANNMISGNNNVVLGFNAAASLTTGSSNIIIGSGLDVPGSGQSSYLDIGNAIYGDLSTGNIGIGGASGTDKLTVTGNVRASGQISSASQTLTSGTSTVDFDTGNAISTDYNCGSNITLNSLRDGGSYTLVARDTGTTQCSFSTTTTGTDAATVTYRFKPANAARTSSSHTIYTLLRVGTVVYVSWVTGF